ncbi:hypothetical protein K435DRAFT_857524 [Dendrothele bispora CBS 962.96]|uniref:Uncharacterized protein n=1 Tax=Dendrothele bispora (strain CBS 962.96) TaxID=1314807 RepID=A0A4S8M5H6_DENBC|nr:hypothetical protein K435DRAFT_857524 [Dendrothele bispora CBS 962.96]
MLDFLFPSSRTRSRDVYEKLEAGADKPRPTPSAPMSLQPKKPQPKLQLNTSIIGNPVLPTAPQSITGFDDIDGRWVPRPNNPSPRSPSSPSSSRSGPSAIAWLRPQNSQGTLSSEDAEQYSHPTVLSAPARAALRNRHLYPMDRSVSSPAASPSTPMAPSPSSSQRAARSTPLHTRSSLSLRSDAQSQLNYMNAHAPGYPILVKPLSPIQELEYFPETPRRTVPLPADPDTTPTPTSFGSKASNSSEQTARPSPARSNPFISRTPKRSLSQSSSRSNASEAPSIPPLDLQPAFPGAHPIYDVSVPPSLPPPLPRPKKALTLPIHPMPTIEAAHSSAEFDGTEGDYSRGSLHADSFVTANESTPRMMRLSLSSPADIVEVNLTDEIGLAYPVAYPVDEFPEEYREAAGSLFQLSDPNTILGGGGDRPNSRRLSTPLSFHLPTPTPTVALGAVPHENASVSQSTSESFIQRRWDKDAGFSSGSALGSVRFKSPKKEWIYTTPAFWAFWFGFVCPVLWLVGGWHFTRYGELPPKKTVWEFYFNPKTFFGSKEWWTMGRCWGGRRKKSSTTAAGENVTENGNGTAGPPPPERTVPEVIRDPVTEDVDLEKGMGMGMGKGKGRDQQLPPLPRWIREKQSTESKVFKRSLRGISFGYPFIPRPPPVSPSPQSPSQSAPGALHRCWLMFMFIVTKPNRLFDQVYVVKLTHIKGKKEGRRMMFDPWIQRCRYAFCYAILVFMALLAAASTFLIVYNTRTLR